METTTCPVTGTRTQACACARCSRGSSPQIKHEVNKRDVHALLDLLAGCVEHLDDPENVNWNHVGSMAHLRRQLMGLAIGLLGESESNVRPRLEQALCADDASVADALIDALC